MWSKAFIEEISHTPYHTDFRFICVDPSPHRPALPAWLKQIPTLVIRGESKPRTDNEVMNWLYEQRLRGGAKEKGAASGGSAAAAQETDPEPYLDSEMGGGYGDSYAFLGDDTSAQGNGGTSMRHNFTYLNGQDAVGTKEASHFQSTGSSTHKRSNKEEMLDQQYEQFMKAREQGMPQRISRQ